MGYHPGICTHRGAGTGREALKPSVLHPVPRNPFLVPPANSNSQQPRPFLSPNFLCLVSDLLQQCEVKLSQRHSGSSKQRPSRREKRVLNPKFTEISGEMGQKGGKGKMQGEEITEEEDLDGELKAELAVWEAG